MTKKKVIRIFEREKKSNLGKIVEKGCQEIYAAKIWG